MMNKNKIISLLMVVIFVLTGASIFYRRKSQILEEAYLIQYSKCRQYRMVAIQQAEILETCRQYIILQEKLNKGLQPYKPKSSPSPSLTQT